ncbi:MAG: hypothetical protein OJF48_000806 [Afipia sp.]|nr:MAG: hypothetical protein OJF48_000806 [Afipia sp.]
MRGEVRKRNHPSIVIASEAKQSTFKENGLLRRKRSSQ